MACKTTIVQNIVLLVWVLMAFFNTWTGLDQIKNLVYMHKRIDIIKQVCV